MAQTLLQYLCTTATWKPWIFRWARLSSNYVKREKLSPIFKLWKSQKNEVFICVVGSDTVSFKMWSKCKYSRLFDNWVTQPAHKYYHINWVKAPSINFYGSLRHTPYVRPTAIYIAACYLRVYNCFLRSVYGSRLLGLRQVNYKNRADELKRLLLKSAMKFLMLDASNGKLNFISCLSVPVFVSYHEIADLHAVILVSCNKEKCWNFQK